MTDPILNAQIVQMQAQLDSAKAEKEPYVRLTIILAKALLNNTQMGLVDGNIFIKRSAFEAVPKAFSVTLRPATVESESAEPNADPIEGLVVEVSPRTRTGTSWSSPCSVPRGGA